jgi:ABC-type amino acid transport substrate-binding protein
MRSFKIFICTWVILSSSIIWANDLVIYPAADSSEYNRYQDLINLLEVILEKSTEKYGAYTLKASEGYINESRSITAVSQDSGLLTLTWSAAVKETTNTLLAVHIPTRKGILGYRLFLINKKDQAKFSTVNSLEDLKKLTVLQGPGWKDIQVFQKNNIAVVEGSNYEGLFQMIDNGRVDFFSRGITEIFPELEERKDKLANLAIEETIALYYPWPYYYWVNKQNTRLKDRLEYGFSIITEDGTMDELFNNNYGDLIEQADLKNRKLFKIDNPFLWDEIPLENKNLWYEL